MVRMFYNKKTSVAFVAAMLLLIILVCMLLVTLTQMVSMNQRVDELQTLIKKAQADKEELDALLEYKKTDAYVIDWAIQHGLLSKDDVSWIQNNVTNK